MKRSILYALLLLAAHAALSQNEIPNPGFETWSAGNPVNWSTTNSGFVTNVTQSSVARSGSSSVRGEVVLFATIPYPPAANSGVPLGQGIPITRNYSSVTGWYQWRPNAVLPNVGFAVVVSFYDAQNGGVAQGTLLLTPQATSWTQFTVMMNYGGGTGQPATRALIQFTVGIPQGTPNTVIGSYFLVDDVAFGPPNSVEQLEGAMPLAYALQQNYPNPFNPSTNIRFSIPEQSHVRLRVFNLLGEEVSTLVNEELRGGNYVADWNATGLASGAYFYVLDANGRVLSKRMILTK